MEIEQPARSKIIHFEKVFQFILSGKKQLSIFLILSVITRMIGGSTPIKDISSIEFSFQEVLARYKQIVFNQDSIN